MAEGGSGSTVPRRMLGRQLRRLRETAGVSVAEACRTIEVSTQTMWRLEGGQPVKLKDIYIRALCTLYGVSDYDTAALLGLVAETKRTGWWHSYGDAVPTHFDLYMGLEEAAKRLTMFQLTLLPGMVQTANYRRAMIWTVYPQMPTAEVERRVELVTKRQQRLNDSEFGLDVLLSESALHHEAGGPAVMAEQLAHLMEVGKRQNVSVRVIPQSVGSWIGLQAGHFILLEFPLHRETKWTEPPVVYVEGYTGALYLDRDNEIRQYRAAIAEIQRVALDESDTRDLVTRITREYAA
ncbi:helix-turn-helix domain-containing protein [Nocardia sp. NPDC050406]|uniref:helix-turn-helix domain-containing protein n=1 Tax=Nocardia sp. NPDC050406 TaxID=3364318 RepID=UPI00378AD13A